MTLTPRPLTHEMDDVATGQPHAARPSRFVLSTSPVSEQVSTSQDLLQQLLLSSYGSLNGDVRELKARLSALEIVHPRMSPPGNADLQRHRSTALAKLAEFGNSICDDDEVAAYTTLASLRADLRNARDAKGIDRKRRHALSTIVDAISYTPSHQITASMAEALSRAIIVALAEKSPSDSELEAVQLILEGVSFEFFPVDAEQP